MSHSHHPDIHEKVYHAGDTAFSIADLLASASDEKYMTKGLPRISDFHLKVGQAVRFRMDQELRSIPKGELLTNELMRKLILPLLPENKREHFKEQDIFEVDTSFELDVKDGVRNRYRINAFYDNSGMAAVIRYLPPRLPLSDQLGFPYEDIWKRIISLKQGLVVVSGITGSGKSTTIACLLNLINQSRGSHIITLEEPIEYVFNSERSLVSQREVSKHTKSFATGLRAALHEDPDIIYVGEVRDTETAALALTAAETGHLVFTTLHTRDAIGGILRLIDLFPPEREKEITSQLSLSIAYVISQKLVPRVDGAGRAVAMEVLRNTAAVGHSIRSGKLHQIYSMMETGGELSMITMEQRLIDLANVGVISKENAVYYANRDDVVDRLFPNG